MLATRISVVIACTAVALYCTRDLTELEKPIAEQESMGGHAERPVRVILKVRTIAGSVERAREEVARIARQAGASRVEPIGEQPLIVIEITPSQLREVMKSDLVTDVQRDRPEGFQ